MDLSALDYVAAGAAALAAGAINALAGGGTLVSFPTLIGIGVPAITANVTNTVALCPGYLAGTYAQREDLLTQATRVRRLAAVAAVGGLAGSVLLVVTPDKAFRSAVPFLILLSCALLGAGPRVQARLRRKASAPGSSAVPGSSTAPGSSAVPGSSSASLPVEAAPPPSVAMTVVVGLAAVYGGFFGAGLGILLLALLGLFSDDSLVRLNAAKQALSLVVNVVAAVFFAFSGHVRWELVPIMAVASLAGGHFGGRMARRVDQTILRRAVILAGIGVAISLWVA